MLEQQETTKIRSTFMMHIVNYSRWDAIGTPNKLNFCLLEKKPNKYFSLLTSPNFGARTKFDLNFRLLKDFSETETLHCHYLFVDRSSESAALYAQLNALKRNMVTIGESSEFIDHGGLMSLIEEFDKIKIYINRERYKAISVKLSSILLKFANFTG
ncbi:YfiR family protein [Aliiglaciecola sp. LCG003]|uniref:YfiR family protein n=1 Tax=Aliiglaciecola sp. LCG003 TaxID=3053655 RepID=UPI002573693B|nr:YfiR family protein [Aliiglaciecola sp. LCG003]WJG09727.1 YfiR family protein [Aliiglaciecola sp. LCG003]